MLNAFIAKLRRSDLPAEDLALFHDVLHQISRVDASRDLFNHDTPSGQLHVLLDGCACKYRGTLNGARQIVYVYLPGDICDLEWLSHQQRTSNVTAITECVVAMFSAEWLARMFSERPAIREAFRVLMVDEALALTERIVSLCSTSAKQKVAYLLFDLLKRIEVVDQSQSSIFQMGLTQAEMAETVGLSYIHVNRLLQNLRDEGVIAYKGRTYTVLDRDKLRDYAMIGAKRAQENLPIVKRL